MNSKQNNLDLGCRTVPPMYTFCRVVTSFYISFYCCILFYYICYVMAKLSIRVLILMLRKSQKNNLYSYSLVSHTGTVRKSHPSNWVWLCLNCFVLFFPPCFSGSRNEEIVMSTTGGIPCMVPLQSRGQKTIYVIWVKVQPNSFNTQTPLSLISLPF